MPISLDSRFRGNDNKEPAATFYESVMVNQTRAIDKMRILKQIGTLEESYLRKIDTALKLHYDLT